MKIYDNITQLIGNTPLIRLSRIEKQWNCLSSIIAKAENLNPLGSVKDRVGYNMIISALKKGEIDKNTTIIEPTSGNTGISLASTASVLGMRCILVMPKSMSEERRKLLTALGATLVLTPANEGMQGSINKANELLRSIDNSAILGQFTSLSNPNSHIQTANEIINDSDGKIDYFVCCIGTGGTISGVGKVLKERIPNIKIIGVEPAESPLITKGVSAPHKIQGIGANFIPPILDTTIIDEVVTVSANDAYQTSRLVGKKEGFLVGISSGASLFACKRISQNEKNKQIVVLLHDDGDRYLSSDLFE